jgi:N-acyl-D-amino-acid deacylase
MTEEARAQGAGGIGGFSADTGSFSLGEYIESLDIMGMSANMAWLVGHNTIRAVAGVVGSSVTEEQYKRMEHLLRESLDAGAVGFSTGLEFEPGRSARPEEMKRLVKIVKEYDAIYTSHIRNRADMVLSAVDEFLDAQASVECRGEISHMNIRYNTGAPEGAFELCVKRIEKARSQGLEVLADMTPLNYGIGLMTGILPPWLRAEGIEKAVEYLKDPAARRRLRNDCDRYWRFIHRGEWDRVRMQTNPAFPDINGLDFNQIADLWKKDQWDCYFDILAAAGGGMDGIILTARLFSDEHLRETISHPLYMLVVDGYSTRKDGPLSKETAFPLHFMGMVYFIAHHVRKMKTLSLEEAIRKMTSMPATHFRLKDRGLLRKGLYADIVVFDYEKLDPVSTIEAPLAYVNGVEHVFVNGTRVINKGIHTGARPGKNLLR